MFVKAACTCIAMVVIMFTYSWKLTLYALVLITPTLFGNRIFMSWMMKYNETYQTEKAAVGSMAQEAISNIRTVKAFADEKGSLEMYKVGNQKVYMEGVKKARVYGAFYFSFTVLQQAAFACILYIIGVTYEDETLTVGNTMAYLLYMRKIVDNFSEMSNAFIAISKVKGASYKVAELIVSQPKVVFATNGKQEIGAEGTVDLKNVKFSYPTMPDVAVLKNATIHAPSNKVLAFVGASGKFFIRNANTLFIRMW